MVTVSTNKWSRHRGHTVAQKRKKRLAVLSERVYTFHVVDVTMSTA